MNTFARYAGILTVAVALTVGVFLGMGKVTTPPKAATKSSSSTEITFDPEYTSENSERPLAPDTKGRGYQYFEKPEFPAPHYQNTVCGFGGKCEDIQFSFTLDGPRSSGNIDRWPPVFPRNASKSGSCTFDLEIDERGKTSSIKGLKCSEAVFVEPTRKAAMKWVFRPSIKNGELVTSAAPDQKIIYRLLDENGNVIPE